MNRRTPLVCVALLLAASVLLALPGVASPCDCHSRHVRHQGGVIKVYPTGHDDTANLRCALRAALREPGQTIELAAGQFWTQQLWSIGFVGTLKGQGADKTFLSNRGPLRTSPGEDVLMKPPSASNRWPALLTFVDGDFTVADLAIRMKGPKTSTGFSFFGSWFENLIIAEIVVTGSKADASFQRLAIEGALVDEGSNAPWGDLLGIMYQPTLGGYANFLSGRFDVIGSSFTRTGMGFNAGVVEHAQITWHANTVKDSGAGFEVWDAAHAVVQATGNRLETDGVAPLYAYPSPYPAIGVGYWTFTGLGMKDTSVYVTDNQIAGPPAQAGLWVMPFASDTARVFSAGNTFTGTTGIYLGPDSKGVIVKKDGAPVVDDGTGNYVLAP
jgi:hypothetical protein